MRKTQSKLIKHGELWTNEQYELVEIGDWFEIRRKTNKDKHLEATLG